MLPNEDLARWGEPPTDERELELAELLAEILRHDAQVEEKSTPTSDHVEHRRDAAGLLDVCRWIEEMMTTISTQVDTQENPIRPLESTTEFSPLELRLIVHRFAAGSWNMVASTHRPPCVLRDLRRVPDDSDRLSLRTGDRVRIDVLANQDGYLLVYNIGPQGNVNILYPFRRGETGRIRAREPHQVTDVEMTPPIGRERLYAVWSQSPLIHKDLQLRDMKRVEQAVPSPLPVDAHVVSLELEQTH